MLNQQTTQNYRITFALAILYLAVVAYGSLLPFDFITTEHATAAPLQRLGDLLAAPTWSLGPAHDLLCNALLYLPFGWLAVTAARLRQRSGLPTALLAILITAAVAWTLECLQGLMPIRVASSTDWLCNVSGAGIGALAAIILYPLTAQIAHAVSHFAQHTARRLGKWTGRRTAAIVLLLLCVVVVRYWFDAFPEPHRLVGPAMGRINPMPGLLHFMMPYDSAALTILRQAGGFALLAGLMSLALGKGRPCARSASVVLGVVLIALGAEVMKLYDAGRYPDITDPLLAALTAAAVATALHRVSISGNDVIPA